MNSLRMPKCTSNIGQRDAHPPGRDTIFSSSLTKERQLPSRPPPPFSPTPSSLLALFYQQPRLYEHWHNWLSLTKVFFHPFFSSKPTKVHTNQLKLRVKPSEHVEGFIPSESLRMMGKIKRGGGNPAPIQFFFFLLIHVTFLSLVFRSMARDPFFSIKPSNSTFPFHSSLQASKQASKNLHDRSTTQFRKCEVRDLLGTSDKSNHIEMLSLTIP